MDKPTFLELFFIPNEMRIKFSNALSPSCTEVHHHVVKVFIQRLIKVIIEVVKRNKFKHLLMVLPELVFILLL
jgi:hypothetical protein